MFFLQHTQRGWGVFPQPFSPFFWSRAAPRLQFCKELSFFSEPEMVYWRGAGVSLPVRLSCPHRVCGWSPWHMLDSEFHLPSEAELSQPCSWVLGHISWAGQMLESVIIFAFIAPQFPVLMWMTHSYSESFKQILFDFLAPANMCLWNEVLPLALVHAEAKLSLLLALWQMSWSLLHPLLHQPGGCSVLQLTLPLVIHFRAFWPLAVLNLAVSWVHQTL